MRTVVYLIISLALAGIDQAIKAVIRQMPAGVFPIRAGHLFMITRVFNPGISFSIGKRFPFAVTIVSAVLVLICILFLFSFKRKSEKLIWACSLGGMMGNLIDRLLFGAVTDYLILRPLPYFVCNFADACIFFGVAGLIICLFFRRDD